jgi:plastocyanin
MRRRLPLLSLGLVLALAAPAHAADQAVNATNSNTFSPSSVTINVNEKVTWTNQGGYHNVVFDDGSYTQPGEPSFSMWTVDRTFTSAGTFRYHCGFHGTSMSGTVVVQGEGGSPPPPGDTPDTTPPDIDSLRVAPSTFCNRKTKLCKKRGAVIRFTIDEDAKISGRIIRRKDGRRVGTLSITATEGANEFDLSGKGLALGKYRLELTPRDAAGNKAAKPSRANFTIATKRG